MTYRAALVSLLALFTMLATGCGVLSGNPPGQPELEDYERSCSVDGECAITWLARACSCSAQVALNVSSLDDVEQDNEEELRHQDRCSVQPGCAAHAPAEAYCNAGTCDYRPLTTMMQ